MMKWPKNIFKNLFLDTVESMRVLKLLPLLIGLSLLIYLAKDSGRSPVPVFIYTAADSTSSPIYSTRPLSESSKEYIDNKPSAETSPDQVFTPFDFDPNTLSLEEFESLGFTTKQAQVIVNYRNAGAKFYKPEDFARCYTVSDEIFDILRPYIKIAGSRKKNTQVQPATAETLVEVVDSNALRAAELFMNPRDTLDFPIELNGADSATLVLVRGIGSLTAGRIVEYREKLGGFVSIEQLSQVKGMTEHNYLLILKEIYVDSCNIKKIDVNFATPKQMSLHPYISAKGLAKIVKNRQLKGGWRTSEEFRDDNILDRDEFERLRPYMLFNAQQSPEN